MQRALQDQTGYGNLGDNIGGLSGGQAICFSTGRKQPCPYSIHFRMGGTAGGYFSRISGNTIFSRRRELADWARLQLYGIPWAATGIDQDYPAHYPAAEIDLEPDAAFHDISRGTT